MDLADGHLAAVGELKKRSSSYEIFNLGTGVGTSVTQLVHAFAEANNVDIPVSISPRRIGDVPVCFADASKANDVLGWKAQRSVYDMCISAWRFVQR
jgi:UDP-glucose 4-epimerase